MFRREDLLGQLQSQAKNWFGREHFSLLLRLQIGFAMQLLVMCRILRRNGAQSAPSQSAHLCFKYLQTKPIDYFWMARNENTCMMRGISSGEQQKHNGSGYTLAPLWIWRVPRGNLLSSKNDSQRLTINNYSGWLSTCVAKETRCDACGDCQGALQVGCFGLWQNCLCAELS